MLKTISDLRAILTGFIAGFYAVLCFHQLALVILYSLGITSIRPFNMHATSPFGIPSVISASIWGGFWGIFFAIAFFRRTRGASYWALSIIAGAVLLSLIAAVIVAPLKGLGLFWGWDMERTAIVLFINGCWGLGTGIIYRLLNR